MSVKTYLNYRVAVEAFIIREGSAGKEVLLCKRSPNETLKPNVWSVRAGKVEYDEIPDDAIVRECDEEVGYVGEFTQFHMRTAKFPNVHGGRCYGY